jgi:hypothetical protein
MVFSLGIKVPPVLAGLASLQHARKRLYPLPIFLTDSRIATRHSCGGRNPVWTPDQVRGDGLIPASRTKILAIAIIGIRFSTNTIETSVGADLCVCPLFGRTLRCAPYQRTDGSTSFQLLRVAKAGVFLVNSHGPVRCRPC